MEYITLFDVTNTGYNWFPILILCFTFLVFDLIKQMSQQAGQEATADLRGIVRSGALVCLILMSIALTLLYSPVLYYQIILLQNRADVIEGVIVGFQPMPKGGHGRESFRVQGVQFAYSEYEINPAFHTTRIYGSPLRDGIFVRIYYTKSIQFFDNNAIIRLQIKQ